jgi:hypothetical protein
MSTVATDTASQEAQAFTLPEQTQQRFDKEVAKYPADQKVSAVMSK